MATGLTLLVLTDAMLIHDSEAEDIGDLRRDARGIYPAELQVARLDEIRKPGMLPGRPPLRVVACG